jgi:hypothetical protein
VGRGSCDLVVDAGAGGDGLDGFHEGVAGGRDVPLAWVLGAVGGEWRGHAVVLARLGDVGVVLGVQREGRGELEVRGDGGSGEHGGDGEGGAEGKHRVVSVCCVCLVGVECVFLSEVALCVKLVVQDRSKTESVIVCCLLRLVVAKESVWRFLVLWWKFFGVSFFCAYDEDQLGVKVGWRKLGEGGRKEDDSKKKMVM